MCRVLVYTELKAEKHQNSAKPALVGYWHVCGQLPFCDNPTGVSVTHVAYWHVLQFQSCYHIYIRFQCTFACMAVRHACTLIALACV